MSNINPIALFRHAILGQLTSRDDLERGELSKMIKEISSKTYTKPDKSVINISQRTIEDWYYAFRHGGIDALAPQTRSDINTCKLPVEIQDIIVQQKQQYPKRSINRIIKTLESDGIVALGSLSRSTVHRLLVARGLNKLAAPVGQERRSFEAPYAGSMWQGDVMHGPRALARGRTVKTYLVTWIDDASRLIVHSEFRTSETAIDVEVVLKQAIMKRGIPYTIYIDNGPAYRSATLQAACIRLGIQVVYATAYSPESKGKIERWHGTLRKQFLAELPKSPLTLLELNERLWNWLDNEYHNKMHAGIKDTPINKYREDLQHIRELGHKAKMLDELFLYRYKRRVRKDGTISYNSHIYEVPYQLVGSYIMAVVDPNTQQVISIENLKEEPLGKATLLDKKANNQRVRHSNKKENADV